MTTEHAERLQRMDHSSWAYAGASLYDYVRPPGTTEAGRLCGIVGAVQRDPFLDREWRIVSGHDGRSCMPSHGARWSVSERRMLESANWKALRW